MTFNQNPTQLVNKFSIVLAFWDLYAHPAHCLRQFPHNFLQPLRLVHLLQLSGDRLQSLLQFHNFRVFFINVFTDLRLSQLLQHCCRVPQPLKGLFVHSAVRMDQFLHSDFSILQLAQQFYQFFLVFVYSGQLSLSCLVATVCPQLLPLTTSYLL
jgi:hypothetical protein